MIYIKLFFMFIWAIVAMPIMWAVRYVPGLRWLAPSFHRFYFKVYCLFLGLHSRVRHGRIVGGKKVLLLCNHMSYLDILAIGRLLKINFVAKEDVATWPLFGVITRLGNTVFISRRRMAAAGEVSVIEQAFDGRRIPLLIFPEGTSGDGASILSFKSSMFSIFEGGGAADIIVQPMAIAYTRRGRRRMTLAERQLYSWYLPEQTLAQHFGAIRDKFPVSAEISIGEPLDLAKYANRKEMAAAAHAAVEREFNRLVEE
ncbi:MAG: 1-acyl-sn-glycerol-3-phosphate acyltransferase [Rickettsiales bacterium]|jgi:1-acyl-sn-glycerol-3-phosphate acyltransferase|nr:1-acyl-sn-glycerol-3-phosphate acyltransferase [Rickettsiales bacterium]